MKLTIPERITVMNLLPQKGDYLTLQIVQDLVKALNLSNKEIESAAIQTLPDGSIRWEREAAVKIVKDIPFTEAAKTIIETQLKELDKKKELTVAMMPVYKKFMFPAEEGKKKK